MLHEPAFAVAESIESQRWDRHYSELNYDEAVRERAEELSALFPDDIELFAAANPAYAFLLASDDAQDAYAEFVDRLCLDKAKAEWS